MPSDRRRSRIFPRPGALRFVTCLWIGCALLSPVSSQSFFTQGRYGKRQEAHTSSLFLSGSRYGRNDGLAERSSKTLPKPLEVLPRVDRFFLGSRYGKRMPLQANSVHSLSRLSDILEFMNRAGYESSSVLSLPQDSVRRFGQNSSKLRLKPSTEEALGSFADQVEGAVEREIESERRQDEERESEIAEKRERVRDQERDSASRQ